MYVYYAGTLGGGGPISLEQILQHLFKTEQANNVATETDIMELFISKYLRELLLG